MGSLFTNLVCCSQQILRPAKTFLGSPSGSLARNMSTANGLSNASSCQNPDGAQDQEKCHTRISKHNRGWRRIVRNFTPSWFSVCMGTGIVSILLHNLPYNGQWLYYLSIVVFCLNIGLFVSFFIISVIRYTLYPEIWWVMIKHPAQSLFLGTFPMALATIVNMIVFVCVPAWGERFVQLAWGLWWIDVALSLACCFYMPFVIMYIHQATLQTMTAAWLLPIGPLGQGGFAIMQLGKVAMDIFPITHTLPLSPNEGSVNAGQFLYIIGWLTATVMWGFGLVWLFFAAASITRSRFPFNMGWWGFTFPLGVFATSTTQMAKELPSEFFKVLGTIFSVAVTLLWIMVAVGTVRRAWTGEIFFAPCLKDLEGKKAQAEQNCPEQMTV